MLGKAARPHRRLARGTRHLLRRCRSGIAAVFGSIATLQRYDILAGRRCRVLCRIFVRPETTNGPSGRHAAKQESDRRPEEHHRYGKEIPHRRQCLRHGGKNEIDRPAHEPCGRYQQPQAKQPATPIDRRRLFFRLEEGPAATSIESHGGSSRDRDRPTILVPPPAILQRRRIERPL